MDGKERRSAATKAYWARYREKKSREDTLREELEARQEKRRKMREKCSGYIPQPITEMNDSEARCFAITSAMSAQGTMHMSDDETLMYASALYYSIQYFNRRSEEHAQYMAYKENCRSEMAARQASQVQDADALIGAC